METARSRRRSYHHGNLRDALIDVAIELIGRDGAAAFSIAEACRRLDVSPGAPYRHFADREELLTAIAIRSCEVLGEARLSKRGRNHRSGRATRPGGRAYVEFAAQHPALFEVLYAKEVFVGGNAKLIEPVAPWWRYSCCPRSRYPASPRNRPASLTVGSAAVAHGYATFLPAGTFSEARKRSLSPQTTPRAQPGRWSRAAPPWPGRRVNPGSRWRDCRFEMDRRRGGRDGKARMTVDRPPGAVTLPPQMFDLTGRTALVTGASSGLGVQFALALQSPGAQVVVAARRADGLKALVRSTSRPDRRVV